MPIPAKGPPRRPERPVAWLTRFGLGGHGAALRSLFGGQPTLEHPPGAFARGLDRLLGHFLDPLADAGLDLASECGSLGLELAATLGVDLPNHRADGETE